MNNIDFEKDRVDSITQVDQTKSLIAGGSMKIEF